MNVVLGSAWRNAAGLQTTKYFSQAAALYVDLLKRGHSLRVIAVEGDSVDGTRDCIKAEAARYGLFLDLRTKNHGGPVFSSTEHPERMEALSGVGNEILAGVRNTDDVLVYVESDLIWKPDTIVRCIDQLGTGIDVVAPMTFAGEHFYDVWAFRVNGSRFGPFAPFYDRLRLDSLTPVDSVGSCLVMKADVARKTAPMTNGAIVEWCANARNAGFKLFCDARERIHHP